MAENTPTPADLIDNITLLMMQRPNAEGKLLGQPNMAAWGVITSDMKSHKATDADIRTKLSANLQRYRDSFNRLVDLQAVDQDAMTPEQQQALTTLEHQGTDALNKLSELVGGALQDPQVRGKLQEAILNNPANKGKDAQQVIKTLFSDYAKAHPAAPAQEVTPPASQPSPAPQSPVPSPKRELKPAALQDVHVQPVVATDTSIIVPRGKEREAVLKNQPSAGETLSGVENAFLGLAAGGVTGWMAMKYLTNPERLGRWDRFDKGWRDAMEKYGFTKDSPMTIRGWWANMNRHLFEKQNMTQTTPSDLGNSAASAPSAATSVAGQPTSTSTSGTAYGAQVNPANPTPAGGGTSASGGAAAGAQGNPASNSASGGGAAARPSPSNPAPAAGGGAAAAGATAAEGSMLTRGSKWLMKRLGVPLAIGMTVYEASGDLKVGDYRGAAAKAGGALGALGGAATGATIGTMIWPGVGTVLGGLGGGIAGLFAGEKGGQWAYEQAAGPQTAEERKEILQARAKVEDTPDDPNESRLTMQHGLTWGSVLGTAAAMTRKSGWGRLGALIVGGGAGLIAGSNYGEHLDKQAAKDRAAAKKDKGAGDPAAETDESGETVAPPKAGADTDSDKAKKAKAKKDEQKPLATGEDEPGSGFGKGIIKFIMMIVALFSPDSAKSVGTWLADLMGVKLDDEVPAASAGQNTDPRDPKAQWKIAEPGSREEMQAFMELIQDPKNAGLSSKMQSIMLAYYGSHSRDKGFESDDFMQLNQLAEGVKAGKADAIAKAPGEMLKLMEKYPELGEQLKAEVFSPLRDQHRAQIVAHNSALDTAAAVSAKVATPPKLDAAPPPSTAHQPPPASVDAQGPHAKPATVAYGQSETNKTLPPSISEMTALLAQLDREGSTGVREKFSDLIHGHGFRAFQKGASDPFLAYHLAENAGDKGKMAGALLNIVEQYPDFRRELYRGVMPVALDPKEVMNMRAIDTLMQQGQEGKIQQFTNLAADRLKTFDQVAANGGPEQNGFAHRSLVEAGKRLEHGETGVRESLPDIITTVIAADPALRQSLLELARSVDQPPRQLPQISTALPLTGITPLVGGPLQQGKSGVAVQVLPDSRAQRVAVSADQEPGLFERIKNVVWDGLTTRGSYRGGDFLTHVAREAEAKRNGNGRTDYRSLRQPVMINGHVVDGQLPGSRTANTATQIQTNRTFVFGFPPGGH